MKITYFDEDEGQLKTSATEFEKNGSEYVGVERIELPEKTPPTLYVEITLPPHFAALLERDFIPRIRMDTGKIRALPFFNRFVQKDKMNQSVLFMRIISLDDVLPQGTGSGELEFHAYFESPIFGEEIIHVPFDRGDPQT